MSLRRFQRDVEPVISLLRQALFEDTGEYAPIREGSGISTAAG